MRIWIGLLAALAVWTSCAVAEDYKWYYDNEPTKPWPSADAACPQSVPWYDNGTYAHTHVDFQQQPGYGVCYGVVTWPGGGTMMQSMGKVYRTGDSCPAGATYNEKTGACDQSDKKDGELCEDQQGHGPSNPMIWSKAAGACVSLVAADLPATCGYFGGRGETAYSVAGQLDTAGQAVAPPTFTGQMGCEVSTVSTSECTINVKGAISCNVTAKFTGNVAGNEAGPDPRDKTCEDDKCAPLEPKVETTDKPCVMSGGSCTSETETSKEGSQSCGSFNGNYICATKTPSSKGTKIETTVKSEIQADGSVKTVKTDTATRTTCSDVKTCTTQTSTTTTTTTTNKSGQTTDTQVICRGGCDGNGNGYGSGDGDGDGEGEEDGGKASASEECTAPPVCDGDTFLCSILRQVWINSCAERALPTAKEKAEFQAMMDKQKSELDQNQKSLDDKVTSLISDFQSAGNSSGGSGKCFEDKTFQVQGQSITIPFSQACGILEWFRYAILAVAYLISFRIVTREL